MNRVVLGLLLGALLAGLRSPLGAEWVDWPALGAEPAYRLRALGLLCTAGILLCSGPILDGRPQGLLLVGLALGFSGTSLLGQLQPGGMNSTFPLLPFALVAILIMEHHRSPARGEDSKAYDIRVIPPAVMVLLGAGFAVGIEGPARILRRLGGSTTLDDGVFASVFLMAVAAGGLVFGRALHRAKRDRAGGGALVGVGLLGALGLLVGLVAVRGVSTPRGLREYLAEFGMDPSLYGQLPYDALLGCLVFVAPGFALGTVLYGARTRGELASLLVGAAAATFWVPLLLDHGATLDPVAGPHSSQLVPLGVKLIALAGLAWVWLQRARIGHAGPRFLLVAAVGVMFLGFFVNVQQVRVLKAWTRFPRPVAEVFETPQGQLSIHPSAPGVERVALDHRDITPGADGGRIDAQRLRASMALLDSQVRSAGASVLLLGQLSPGRAMVLAEGGARHVDRSAGWWRSMPWLESRLFDGRSSLLPGSGRAMAPEDAGRRLEAGEYDLVIALPVGADVPAIPPLAPPPGTIVVLWMDGQAPAPAASVGVPVLAVSDGLELLSIGLVAGTSLEPRPIADRPAALLLGDPVDRPGRLEWLFLRPDQRRRRNMADLGQRLAESNGESDWRFVCAALATHYAGQRHSSPWATRAEATELDEATLVELSEALTVGRPDLLTRELWNGLAAVLVAKREVEAIDSWISPAAQMWAPWPGLERALAHAELESLDPEAAVERLQRLRTLAPLELRDTQLLAEAQARAGRSGDAIGTWRDLHRRDPLNLEVRRGLALALAAGGELEEARPLLRELLEENPQDRELWSVLAPQEEAASKGTEEDGS